MKSVKKAVKKAAVARKKAVAKKKKAAVARPKVDAVAAARGEAKVDPRTALREEYTIEARNFGPIEEAKLTLKPLTVLIGPSNTGKTYMATLACMMMKKHVEFVNIARSRIFGETDYETMLHEASISELREFSAKLFDAAEEDSFVLSALPGKFQKLWRPVIKDTFRRVWQDVDADLRNFYGVAQLSDLLAGDARGSFKCECIVNSNDEKMSTVRIGESEKTAIAALDFRGFRFPVSSPQMFSPIHKMMREVNSPSFAQRKSAVSVEMVVVGILAGAAERPSAHFLPASRGGLIQAQRVMSIAMMRIAGRAGLSDIRIPTLSRLNVDFLEEIELLLGRISKPRQEITPLGIRHRAKFSRRTISESTKVAERIEDFLGGQIVPKKSGNGGASAIPSIVTMGYRPAEFADLGIDIILDMAQSSSMVGELAPLVLYLKGGIEPGDTLFIEEPEAHLHPAAQTKMAEILAAMVRAGIRVVITTHSDWILSSIANIVRRGELGENESEEAALVKGQVGVWLFDRGRGGNKGSTARELTFDSATGYIPENLHDLSNDLHNETADLLDAMDERERANAIARKDAE